MAKERLIWKKGPFLIQLERALFDPQRDRTDRPTVGEDEGGSAPEQRKGKRPFLIRKKVPFLIKNKGPF